MMKHNLKKLSLVLLLGLAACAPKEAAPEHSPEAKSTLSKTETSKKPPAALPWKIPANLPAGELGKQIKLGEEIITYTAKYLGPEMTDPSKRIAGSHLSCKSCHLNAGKQANALGFIGITARYPRYRGRENREVKLSERINGCFERSLNGKALPENTPEMQAILAYMQWLSQDIPKGANMDGQGLPDIELLARAANPETGKAIYAKQCALCHQPTGQGMPVTRDKPERGYVYPALWGADSFNTGAGMHRVITAAKYIKANMPFGNANLTNEEAFDVAAYINAQTRPEKANLDQDFPDRTKKPVDAPFPPWNDKASAEQHKYGPFKPLMQSSEKGS
jgi:thiosulfate dehydrogenase